MQTRKITYLWADTTPVRGPLKFERVVELWREGQIKEKSRLLITELVNEKTNRVLFIYAEQIKDSLDAGTEPNLDLISCEH
jgi:hypothetical protein